MRGILITTLPPGKFNCTVCGASPEAELHAAQGVFWLCPTPHHAPCGQPCIGGGLEDPFQGHLTDQCADPECKVKAPDKIKHYEKAQLPTWAFKILLPMLLSSKDS